MFNNLPNKQHSWRPHIQIPEPIGNISLSNYPKGFHTDECSNKLFLWRDESVLQKAKHFFMEESQTLILILLIERLKELLGNLTRPGTTGLLKKKSDKLFKKQNSVEAAKTTAGAG